MSNERFDRLEDMLATLIDKVDRMEGNFNNMQEDIKKLKGNAEHVKGNSVQIKGEVGQLKANINGLESRLNNIEKNQTAMREEYETRFNIINNKLDTLLALRKKLSREAPSALNGKV